MEEKELELSNAIKSRKKYEILLFVSLGLLIILIFNRYFYFLKIF